MKRIYFDNASTTPLYKEVKELMCDVMENEYGNPSSIHAHGRKARSIIENARKTVAHILNASLGEIFFTGTASEANNMVLKMSVLSLGVTRIITSPTEHPCVLNTCSYLKTYHNTLIEFLRVDHLGNIDITHLSSLLSTNHEGKTLVSIMHGNNEIGTMINLDSISDICAKNNALFHCDTVQTIGKYPIDLSKTRVSFLSASAHKFHGPKGVGFVYINNDNHIIPFINGGAQERNMRAGTENVAGIAGMAKALEMCYSNMEDNRHYIVEIRNHIKKSLTEKFRDITFNGNQENNFLVHVLNVSFPESTKADLLVPNLDMAGISCSSASACSSGVEADSHVLQAIGHDVARKAVRFSFSSFNTMEEADQLIAALEKFTPLR
ncbi:MAG: cysteine desulfurase [Saprospiraceae bacterium]|nr:cysteine desulfurase [Saprospiraceae bacterium]